MATNDLWTLRRNGAVVAIGTHEAMLRWARGMADPWARWTLTRYEDEEQAFGGG